MLNTPPCRLQNVVQTRLHRFAHVFARRLNPQLTREQVDYLYREAVHMMATMMEPTAGITQQNLRLVLRHDCQ